MAEQRDRGAPDKSKKRAIMKPSEKFKFCFDWPLSDDTSSRSASEEAPLLFGRGFRAGIDRLEQIKKRQHTSHSNYVESANLHRSAVHWADKKLLDMTPRDWRIFQEEFGISYKGFHGGNARPMRNWEESGLARSLLQAVYKVGYKRPSPIQMAAIPVSLAHKDVIGIAQTGSGKTTSFILPMLHHVSLLAPLDEQDLERPAQGPYALILAPTRELSQQIQDETLKMSCYVDVRVVLLIGRHSIEEQGMQLSRGCEIVIATPGRLLDCLERKFVVLSQCSYIVVDEADTMVAKGFEEQVLGVLNALPLRSVDQRVNRTMCMFSATMPNGVERTAKRLLRDPVIINVGELGQPPNLITQKVRMVNTVLEKLKRLQALLDNSSDPVMVFVNSKKAAKDLVSKLEGQWYKATGLYGDMPQALREKSLRDFKSRSYDCLVATDLAGRGIDIQGDVHVVNYEMPRTIEKYVHRIGRT
ncbi:hypothetical protein GOP47_0000003 [Adiantum capillus-veneris]|uniref:RNA helicase n=1 Tax=Adiantum capillus-veneris TaxID=13818 RepID=A0A9D4VCH4_ADICA|nr:hypothetical protein GOP47_0000003 [Adiantum capillus-veneris]